MGVYIDIKSKKENEHAESDTFPRHLCDASKLYFQCLGCHSFL